MASLSGALSVLFTAAYLYLLKISPSASLSQVLGMRLDSLPSAVSVTVLLMSIFYLGSNSYIFRTRIQGIDQIGPLVVQASVLLIDVKYFYDPLTRELKPRKVMKSLPEVLHSRLLRFFQLFCK
jgi:hypothetical protein